MATSPSTAEEVARPCRGALATVQRQPAVTPALATGGRHRATVSRSAWPGLFHGAEVPGRPRTNNARAGHVRATPRRLLQTTGQQGHTQRTRPRQGAWARLPHDPTEAK